MTAKKTAKAAKKAEATDTPPGPVAGAVVLDDGGRPLTDDGGRPVVAGDAK